jgi:hypothetical protein
MMTTLSSTTTWSFLKKGTCIAITLFSLVFAFYSTAADFYKLSQQAGGTPLFG